MTRHVILYTHSPQTLGRRFAILGAVCVLSILIAIHGYVHV